MATVYLGIGSNLGDRQANLARALELLPEQKDITILARSAYIETAPCGGPPQGPYLNGAWAVRTDLLPLELLSRLKSIERRLGRPKSDPPGSPRTLDLDILFYDDVVIREGRSLTIPHPRLAERRFVLEPLAEIAPDVVHPRIGKTVRQLLEECGREADSHGSGA